MPTAVIAIGYKAEGKLFKDMERAHISQQMQEELSEALAQYGLYLLLMRLHDVLQHPTGYYESRIQIERMQTERMLTDGGIIYGPWLEGTSERNRATRFKGYHSFRTAVKQLDQKKVEIGTPIVAKYAEELSA